MLFNLSDQRYFLCCHPYSAINCYKYQGPCFGAYDLTTNPPFNGENKLSLRVNGFYNLTTDKEDRNMLTNQKGHKFTIVEFEVWQISNAEPIYFD